jgi:hypothetical protein
MGKTKVDPKTVQRLGEMLQAAHPERYPMKDQDVLLDRILWARYLGPQAKFRIGKEWNWHGGWMHMVGRDRRGAKKMKRLYDAGERYYNGFKIYGGKSEPYIERWNKKIVWGVWQDIEELVDGGSLSPFVRVTKDSGIFCNHGNRT